MTIVHINMIAAVVGFYTGMGGLGTSNNTTTCSFVHPLFSTAANISRLNGCYVCNLRDSDRAFSFLVFGFGLGAVFFDGRASSFSCESGAAELGFLRLRPVTNFGGGMIFLEGDGSAISVPVDPEGGAELDKGVIVVCFDFGGTGRGEAVNLCSGSKVSGGSRSSLAGISC
jgi:hypothetical protein